MTMSVYTDYLEQIEARKGQGLHPKPIEDAELVEALPLGQSIGRADEYVGQDGRPTAMSVAHDAAKMFARCLVWCIESEVLPMVTQVEALLSDSDVFNGGS